jgi:heme-degrading monooxygenase HmoA
MSVVFINIYKTDAEHQQEMLDIIIGAVDNFAAKQPGFICAAIHKSVDSGYVAEVVEWETAEDWNNAHELCKATNPDVDRVVEIASPESALYQVVHAKKL